MLQEQIQELHPSPSNYKTLRINTSAFFTNHEKPVAVINYFPAISGFSFSTDKNRLQTFYPYLTPQIFNKTSVMKKYHILILLTVTALLGESCRKYDESENYLRGILDGQPFEGSSVSANKPERLPGISDDPNLRIVASFPPYILSLMILNEHEIKEGVYNFRSDKDWNASIIANDTENYYAGNAGILSNAIVYGRGSITIKEISKKYVRGSFEFTAVRITPSDSKTVTNGEFSIARE